MASSRMTILPSIGRERSLKGLMSAIDLCESFLLALILAESNTVEWVTNHRLWTDI